MAELEGSDDTPKAVLIRGGPGRFSTGVTGDTAEDEGTRPRGTGGGSSASISAGASVPTRGLAWRDWLGLDDSFGGVSPGLADGVCSVDSGSRSISCASTPDASLTVGEGGGSNAVVVGVGSVVSVDSKGGGLLSAAGDSNGVEDFSSVLSFCIVDEDFASASAGTARVSGAEFCSSA